MFCSKKNLFVFFYFILVLFSRCSAQDNNDTISIKKEFDWKNLSDGIDYCEIDAPKKSVINDSKLSILKINPEKCDFFLFSATEYDRKARTVTEWADSFDLNIVINAGMYNLSKVLLNKGFMKNYSHCNNSVLNPSYNSVIAFNPKDSLSSKFSIIDLTCNSWDSVKSDYHSYAQGMRMIDCNGNPLGWNKRNQSCSMLVVGSDEEGNIYYVFTRSPYTHNEMIGFLLSFPFKMKSTIYMEGGPETSFYIHVGDTKIEKIGSYISNSYANDDNDHFWKLPNVIGVKVRK